MPFASYRTASDRTRSVAVSQACRDRTSDGGEGGVKRDTSPQTKCSPVQPLSRAMRSDSSRTSGLQAVNAVHIHLAPANRCQIMINGKGRGHSRRSKDRILSEYPSAAASDKHRRAARESGLSVGISTACCRAPCLVHRIFRADGGTGRRATEINSACHGRVFSARRARRRRVLIPFLICMLPLCG